jgi:hypothetical protein
MPRRTTFAAYPAHTAIKLILDDHSASNETRAWIAQQLAHRFEFTFTPTHGSWLNLIEGFFSKVFAHNDLNGLRCLTFANDAFDRERLFREVSNAGSPRRWPRVAPPTPSPFCNGVVT